MVASSGPVFSPGIPYFYPPQGPPKFDAHGAHTDIDSWYNSWVQVPWYGQNVGMDQVSYLQNRAWPGQSSQPTMPYTYDATKYHGPKSHGSCPKALYWKKKYTKVNSSHKPARRNNVNNKGKTYSSPKPKSNLTFGDLDVKFITVQKLEQLIIDQLNLDGLPCMHLASVPGVAHIKKRIQETSKVSKNAIRWRLRYALRKKASDAIWSTMIGIIESAYPDMDPKAAAEVRIRIAQLEDKLSEAIGSIAVKNKAVRKQVYAMAGSTDAPQPRQVRKARFWSAKVGARRTC